MAERRMAITSLLTSLYRSMRGATNTASGQARRARVEGIAEWMPKALAS